MHALVEGAEGVVAGGQHALSLLGGELQPARRLEPLVLLLPPTHRAHPAKCARDVSSVGKTTRQHTDLRAYLLQLALLLCLSVADCTLQPGVAGKRLHMQQTLLPRKGSFMPASTWKEAARVAHVEVGGHELLHLRALQPHHTDAQRCHVVHHLLHVRTIEHLSRRSACGASLHPQNLSEHGMEMVTWPTAAPAVECTSNNQHGVEPTPS